MKLKALLLTLSMTMSCVAFAGFDWGSDCAGGDGEFEQYIPYQGGGVEIGTIPKNKNNVTISLTAAQDVDVQLYTATGNPIVAWPNGVLSGADKECRFYNKVEYCYSGYDGVNGEKGREFIEIRGLTNVELIMKAWGYAAGDAVVEYSWEASSNTCSEKGSGNFSQYIPQTQTTVIGDIPAHKVNVNIELRASGGKDVDIQLYDGEKAIVNWAGGLLSGATKSSVDYEGMKITYSGYDGINGNWGHETIEILGRVTRTLTMKAYGYQSGTANVDYEWGIGAGDACGSRGLAPCRDGLMCKDGDDGNIASDIPGECHTEMWCESNESAAKDCANMIHIMTPGHWGCAEFKCQWINDLPVNECADAGYKCVPHITVGQTVVDLPCGGLKASCIDESIVSEGGACGGKVNPPLAPCAEGLVCKGSGLAVDAPGSCQKPNWCESDETVAVDCAHMPNLVPPAYKACVDNTCTNKIHKGSYGDECGGFAGVFCEYGLNCQIEGGTLGQCLPEKGFSWIGGDCNGGFYSKMCVDGLVCDKDEAAHPNVPGTCECPEVVDCEPPYAEDSVCNNQEDFAEICPESVFAL